jgi:exosortase
VKLKRVIAPLLISAFLLLIYFPTFRWLVQSWLHDPNYTHGFLIPLVSGFMIWRKRHELQRAGPSDIGVVVLALGFSVYIVGFVWNIRSLSAFSFLIVLSGLILYFYGTKAIRSLAFPLGFLLFMIPPPFLERMDYSLQSNSIHASAWFLKAVGLPVTTAGPEIHLGDDTFTIGLPCSGINMLIALLALAAVFAYILTGPVYRRAILFVVAFPIAILANIIRIISIILIAHYYNVKFATGFYHDISSLLFFLVAFLFLVLLSWLLGCKLAIPERR